MTRRDLARGVSRSGRWVVAGLLLATGVLVACSYKWEIYLSTFQYQKMQFVSVVPAKKVGDAYVPTCDPSEQPDALTFSFNLVGSQGTQAEDRDSSIRPGDLLKKGETQRSVVEVGTDFNETTFSPLTLECVESYPDPFLTGGGDTCRGVASQSLAPKRLAYRSLYEEANEPVRPSPADQDMLSIAVLLDQSGSMKGYVARDDFAEVKALSFEVYPEQFSEFGTDPNGYRLTAVKSFLARLNANDRAGVFAFGEQKGTEVVCDATAPVGRGRKCIEQADCPAGLTCVSPEAGASGTCEFTFGDKARECFGSNRDLFQKATAFNELVATPTGRTPLWMAVKETYEFLRDNERSPVRHLIVVTDGPDTCALESADFQAKVQYTDPADGKKTAWEQSAPCSSVGYAALRDLIAADRQDAEKPKVRISFLQIQAFGYPARDPLQQELACRTGGHYVFVNSNEFAKDSDTGQPGLEAALKDATERLRYTLAGTWNLTVEVPALADPQFAGTEVALQGTIQMQENRLMPVDQMILGIGQASQGLKIPNYDQRAAVRVPCSGDANCTDLGTECRKSVCQASGVCAGEKLPGGTDACGGGTCCWGACVTCDGTLDEFCNCKAAAL